VIAVIFIFFTIRRLKINDALDKVYNDKHMTIIMIYSVSK